MSMEFSNDWVCRMVDCELLVASMTEADATSTDFNGGSMDLSFHCYLLDAATVAVC